jgi:hypothetical protein
MPISTISTQYENSSNYFEDKLHLRVRDAIEQVFEKNSRQCRYDEWCGELADDENEED